MNGYDLKIKNIQYKSDIKVEHVIKDGSGYHLLKGSLPQNNHTDCVIFGQSLHPFNTPCSHVTPAFKTTNYLGKRHTAILIQ